ncbi:hypothetical protein [Polyangium aurulentum]|uniref:hypothetical protein n=1 Tax=Polyangium aurulentum TaxID=2567896 RepID=UPI0010ADA8D4|nr:hypothetical protein [Polyangium aurulentum]UQA61978.1 hypothetical protein E8A73_016490 [Polyangium aurulentum]
MLLRPPKSAGRLAMAAAIASLVACSGKDRDLGFDPPTTAASSASASSGAGGAGGEGGGAGGEGGAGPIEPDGSAKLTVVNGVNDYDAIELCFLPWPGGDDVAPYPPGTAGLPFAHAAVISPDSGAVPADTDVYLHVIAGDLEVTAGKGCAELVAGAGGPAVVVQPLAVLPASALAAPRSLLLVPTGCLGGPTHTDPLEKAACGLAYSPSTPNPGLVAAAMSRLVKPGRVGLQAVHAAPPMPVTDVRVTPGIPGVMPLQIAPSLSSGAIGPFPSFGSLSRSEYGLIGEMQVHTFPPNGAVASATVPFAQALAQGGMEEGDVLDGRGYTLVAVGALAGISAGPFWHALTFVLVQSDP